MVFLIHLYNKTGRKSTFVFLLLLLFGSSCLQAQDTIVNKTSGAARKKGGIQSVLEKNIYWFDFLEETGPILNSTGKAGEQVINESRYRAHTIKLSFQQPPKYIYSTLYRLPKLGVALYMGNFKNDNIGYPKALYAFFEMPFIYPRAGQRFSFGYNGGLGIAWDFETYDANEERSNVFIGTPRNCYFGFSFYGNYHISRNFLVGVSAGFTHFSNGAKQKPNYGLNIFPVGISVKYKINDCGEQDWFVREKLPKYIKHFRVNLKVSAGQKQNSIGTPVYWKSVAGVNVLYQVSYKYRLGLGVDLNISTGRKDDGEMREKPEEIYNPAIVGSWEWVVLPRIVVPIDIGFYLTPTKDFNDEGSRMYERVGVKGYITKHLWLGFTIKAHTRVADFFEWSLGYTFHNDKNVRKL